MIVDFLMESAILKANYMTNKGLLAMLYKHDCFGVISLFSGSNAINGKYDFLKLLRYGSVCVANVPIATKVKQLHTGLIYKGRWSDGTHYDWIYNMNWVCEKMSSQDNVVFSHKPAFIWMNARDYSFYVWRILKDFPGTNTRAIYPCNPNMKEAMLWGYVIKNTNSSKHVMSMEDESRYQTLTFAQTYFVKIFSTAIRSIKMQDERTLHSLRRYILKKMYPEAKILNDNVLTGTLHGKPIAVAGHMINMLMACSSGEVDIKRYLSSITTNILGVGKTINKLNKLVMVENDVDGELWHSWTDWQLGVCTYIMYSKVFGIKLCFYELVIVCRWLHNIYKIRKAHAIPARFVKRLKEIKADDF
jgi:hypothetical protein